MNYFRAYRQRLMARLTANSNPEGHNQYTEGGAIGGHHDAVKDVRDYLDRINQGHGSNAEIDKAVEKLSKLKGDDVKKAAEALHIYGKTSRKAVVEAVKQQLANQTIMWVKSNA